MFFVLVIVCFFYFLVRPPATDQHRRSSLLTTPSSIYLTTEEQSIAEFVEGISISSEDVVRGLGDQVLYGLTIVVLAVLFTF